jgi:hypothetical protein
MRFGKILLMLVFSLSVIFAATIAPTPASAAQDATILSITVNGCFIDVVFQVQDEGPYFLTVWDDGTQRGRWWVVPANGRPRYTIGDLILQVRLVLGFMRRPPSADCL